MRTSTLARSAVAVATLSVGSAALAAVPAVAATPSGVTRDSIVKFIDGAREDQLQEEGYSRATEAAGIKLAEAACGYTDGEDIYAHSVDISLFTKGSADGGLVTVYLHDNSPTEDEPTHRTCFFGVVVTSDKDDSLSGQATLTLVPRPDGEQPPILTTAAADDSNTGALTGNAFVSATITRDQNVLGSEYSDATFTAAGTAGLATTTTDQRKIWDHKSKAEKKAAKVKYDKRIAKAKKAYAKALDRAGSSSTERAAAKKAYLAKRAETKVKYDYAVWNYRYVTNTKTVTRSTPFNLTASAADNNRG